ncbi:hypothetical protein BJ968_004053 [Kineococcus aurantiacus]|uniref:Uncharacterized protein n=1 Tax=Kineococcus aurantiacus TaxID=37633 RepID=A0A7Y9DPN9_9ACTN|nr:hypothetical protein [Kineococcus aurantiacus]
MQPRRARARQQRPGYQPPGAGGREQRRGRGRPRRHHGHRQGPEVRSHAPVHGRRHTQPAGEPRPAAGPAPGRRRRRPPRRRQQPGAGPHERAGHHDGRRRPPRRAQRGDQDGPEQERRRVHHGLPPQGPGQLRRLQAVRPAGRRERPQLRQAGPDQRPPQERGSAGDETRGQREGLRGGQGHQHPGLPEAVGQAGRLRAADGLGEGEPGGGQPGGGPRTGAVVHELQQRQRGHGQTDPPPRGRGGERRQHGASSLQGRPGLGAGRLPRR